MEEQFFLTKSIISKSTQININKKFFPSIKNRIPLKFSPRKQQENLDSNEEYKKAYKFSLNQSPYLKLKLISSKTSSINNKNKFPVVKSNLTISLNNELSRISVVYGKEDAFKKFTENPVSDHFYEQKNYNAYEIAKINEYREVNYRPKLKPLVMLKEPTLRKLSQSFFYNYINKK